MKVNCKNCGQKYNIESSMFGSEIQCQACQYVMVFHAPEGAVVTPKKVNTVASKSPHLNRSLSPPKRKSSFIPTIVALSVTAMIAVACIQAYLQLKNKEDQQDIAEASKELDSQTLLEDTKEEPSAPTQEPEAKMDEPNELSSQTAAVLATDVIPDISSLRNEKGNLLISHFEDVVKPFAEQHCISCHGPEKEKGDFRIDKLMNTGLIVSEGDAEHWQEVLDLINTGEMPPIEEERPSMEEMTAMLDALYQTTANARDIVASKGNGVMRRRNSREYAHLIKDLLGLTIPEGSIPVDRGFDGFDTLGVDLSTTPAELQSYIDVSYSLMQKLTYDYLGGREIPEEARIVFGDIPKDPTNAQIYDLFERFVVRLYSHQPVTRAMIDDMSALYRSNTRKGASTWEAVAVSLTCGLASPHLIFIVEKEADLNQLDIANRLALLLWSSVPDKTLIQLARKGELTKPEVYAQQFERMIQDSKAERFFHEFTNQWLELDRLDVINIDEELFPEIKDEEDVLKENMTKETLAFIRELIRENRPAREIVNADFTMLNAQLASHYGIKTSGIEEDQFSKVKLESKDKARGGILGQGSIQMLTSNGSRTSPVERGVFILRKLLDSSPPPAPADVPEVADVTGEDQTTRQLLKHHMTTAQCATCHVKIDPLGFGMESFGPIGRWRTHEKNQPIDASGQMTNGKKFDDFEGLISSLAVNDERIAKSFVKAIMSYSIGRKVRFTDSGEVEKIIKSSKANQFKLKDLIFQVTQSETFQTKR